MALDMIREHAPDAVVLDLGLPALSGLEVLSGVRQFSDLPILILSGRTDEYDRIQGLRLGADDYLVKPCSPRELAVRVSTVLRRVRPTAASGTLDYDGLRIDVAAHEVTVDEKTVELTPLEFELLLCLARSPRTVVSRAQLLRTVWDSSTEWQTTATVTEHVRRLRAKIEDAPQDPRWVITVRGSGVPLRTALSRIESRSSGATSGSSTRNTAPGPLTFTISSVPFIASIRLRLTARPRPIPATPARGHPSGRTERTRSACDGSIPGPLSRTSIRACEPTAQVVIVTVLTAGPNLITFESRFSNT